MWETLKRQATGIGGGAGNRRLRLKERVFLVQRLWLPPMHWQQRIRSVAAKLDQTKLAHEATDTELDALLPAVLDKAFRGEL
jgi:type I restriction enzyme, S subunit